MENLVSSLLLTISSDSETPLSSSAHTTHTWFQWGGTVFAIFLLILNRLARPSPTQTTLLVTYLLSSLPTVLFNIVRGEFGCWVAFFAVVAHLLFPREFPVSRFLLFVIMPSWVARKLHDSILGGILCLIIGVLLLIDWIRGIEDSSNCGRDLCYCIGISFLCIFAISYLWKGSW